MMCYDLQSYDITPHDVLSCVAAPEKPQPHARDEADGGGEKAPWPKLTEVSEGAASAEWEARGRQPS